MKVPPSVSSRCLHAFSLTSTTAICYVPRCLPQTRNFAFGTNWKLGSNRKKKVKKAMAKKMTAKAQRNAPEGSAPPVKKASKHPSVPKALRWEDIKDQNIKMPSFLLPTASPNAYLARAAAEHGGLTPEQVWNLVQEPSSAEADDEDYDIDFSVPDLPSIYHRGKRKFMHYDIPVDKKTGLVHPHLEINEVAFLGRSNVGKSSLINKLMGQNLARTSKQPGRTQQAHYFGLVDSRYGDNPEHHPVGFLVDLPGYGFAIGPQKAVSDWQAKTQTLLLQRSRTNHLKRLFLLVDARHGCTDFDTSIMSWLDEACIPYSVVLTKSDAVSDAVKVKWVNMICARFAHAMQAGEAYGPFSMAPLVHVTSAKAGTGIGELLSSIDIEFSLDFDLNVHGKEETIDDQEPEENDVSKVDSTGSTF
jgi:GTP-binding protein